jgi:ATP-dependent DNA ligase
MGHEIKWDGRRLQAHKNTEGVTLFSRPGNAITKRFPAVAEAIAALPGGDLILDGSSSLSRRSTGRISICFAGADQQLWLGSLI